MTTETMPAVEPLERVTPKERTASDVLLAAARYIEEHGWCQDSFMDMGRVCAMGAIYTVGGHLDDMSGDAHDRMCEFLGKGLVAFNDTPGRTEAEVIAALREAAR